MTDLWMNKKQMTPQCDGAKQICCCLDSCLYDACVEIEEEAEEEGTRERRGVTA